MVLQQNLQDLEGLFLELEETSRLADLSGVEINFEISKPHHPLTVQHPSLPRKVV